eukprot:TRINITY_DN10545_c0_g2_i1.p1 TRINITY_DN10545_c0_g2~~TRINITY_DN10545_c0_g2_i1.p1  ORF type:complete len:316 (+),score=131.42 TRINITY_DN10545_c0_g2_i1:82-1029(+)
MLVKALIAAAVLLVLVAGYLVFGYSGATDVRLELHASHPAQWTEKEVSVWLNTTVKYPEYAAVFRSNAVDGPTLFYLSEADLQFMKVKNPVHRAKLLAHLDVLRGKCVCTAPSTIDFWEYLRRQPYRVLYLGALFEFSPRVAFAHTAYFESQAMWDALSFVPGGEAYPTAAFVVAAIAFLVVPHAALMLIGAFALLPTNMFFGTSFVLSHFSKLLIDWRELSELIPELAEPRHTFQLWWNFLFNISTTRTAWLRETLFPLAFIILGPLLPYYATLGIFYLYLVYHIFLFVMYWLEKAATWYQSYAESSENNTATS